MDVIPNSAHEYGEDCPCTPYLDDGDVQLHHGDCIEVLR